MLPAAKGRVEDPGAATVCEFWPLCRKKHVQRSWSEKAQESWAALWSSYTSLCSSLEKNLWVARSSPKRWISGVFLWHHLPFGYLCHRPIAAALSCPGAHSCSPWPVPSWYWGTERLLHFIATGWGPAGAAPEYWAGSWDCTFAGCSLCSEGSCDKMKPLTQIRYSVYCLKSERALGCGWRAENGNGQFRFLGKIHVYLWPQKVPGDWSTCRNCSQTGKAQLSYTMPLRQESFALFLEH